MFLGLQNWYFRWTLNLVNLARIAVPSSYDRKFLYLKRKKKTIKMETDAMPEPPRDRKPSSKKKKNDKSHIPKDATEDKPSYQAVQNIYGNVHNIKDCNGMIHIGHTINFGGTKSKKKSSKSNNSTKEKLNIDTKPPPHVTAVMTKSLDVLTFSDIEIIRNVIKISWNRLAKSIRAHASHVKDGLPHAEAVEKVLRSWIEEHSDSALVAILVHFLWDIREVEAAELLSRIHCTKLIY